MIGNMCSDKKGDMSMFIITENTNNVVIFIAKICEDAGERYKIDESLYVLKSDNFIISEVETVPSVVGTNTHCYTKESGFYENPNYVAPVDPQAELIQRVSDAEIAIVDNDFRLSVLELGL